MSAAISIIFWKQNIYLISDVSHFHCYSVLSQGITNTVGAIPGIVGVALTGYLFDSTHSWSVSKVAVNVSCFSHFLILYHSVNLIYISSLPCRYHYLHHQSSSMWLAPLCGWRSPAVSLKVFLSETDSCSNISLFWAQPRNLETFMQSRFLTGGVYPLGIHTNEIKQVQKNDSIGTLLYVFLFS